MKKNGEELTALRGRRRDFAYPLKVLRVGKSITQEQLAEAMGVSQARVSTLESVELDEADPQLSTLRRYVEALGGELEVRVRVGDRSYRISGPPQKVPPRVPIRGFLREEENEEAK